MKEATMAIKDETIETDVSDAIYWDNRIDASNIIVEVANGVVTLLHYFNSICHDQRSLAD